MKAKNISGQAPGGKRTRLADAIPLSTPYVVQIFPVYACNFKCSYCIFSIDKQQRGFISDKITMDFDLYKKAVDEMTKFPEKIKVLRFVGIGEPLIHKNIVSMVQYAVEKNVANTVEILTNASLLNQNLSDALITAGLNRLVVSLQGTTKEKYKDVCGTDINFDSFVDNLKYFYEHKKQAQVYIKIVDTAIEGKDDENMFFEIFGDICDTMAIEHTVPIHSGIEYENVIKQKDNTVTQFGLPVSEVKICPQPFFTMQINPDGKVVPCFSFEYPEIMGDCNNESIDEIWNGEIYNQFRKKMLDGSEFVSEACKDCNIIKYRLFPEDDLKNDAERLRQFFEVGK
ncbi:MAG: radical SAM protein [Ignavibacteria bacterium]